MKLLIAKVRPASGYAGLAHGGLLALLPILVLLFVQLDLAWLALLMILLAKWRIFAVKPRFWWANLRANSVDLLVSLAVLAFILQTSSFGWQVVWTALHIVWLTLLRARSTSLWVGAQALLGMTAGLGALFVLGDAAPTFLLVLGTGLICYVSAHHFFDAFDERYTKLLSFYWAFFGAALTWVLSHWLIYYPATGMLSQPMLLLTTLGYGIAALYYLDHTQRLSALVRNQLLFITAAVTLLIIIFSDWSDKIV